MAELVRNKGLFTIAVGAGLLLGAAGAFIWQQVYGEKRRRLILQQNVESLDHSIHELKKELELIRAEQKKQRSKRVRRHGAGASSTIAGSVISETEMFSTVGSTIGDEADEFYDFSSDENTIEMDAKEETQEAGCDETGFQSSVAEVDNLFSGNSQDKTKSFGLLLELEEKMENEDGEILWRLARACHSMSSIYALKGDKEKKKDFVLKGIAYGERALAVNPESSDVHKWYAICIGERGQFMGTKDKIQDGYQFREHVETAIRLNPSDAILHHLLGRFFYELAQLSWMERKIADTLFGQVPQGTVQDAIKALLESENINTDQYIGNRLLLAKCYIQSKEYKDAVRWLDSAAGIPPKTDEDKAAQEEIKSFLKKYESYRDH